MAEPLKNSFGPEVFNTLADMLAGSYPAFDRERFVALCSVGFDDLELTERARHVSHALADTLPDDRATALTIITDSLGPEIEETPT